jgi:hypothetical protein
MYKTKTTLETSFEYYDLPFSGHPWDEFWGQNFRLYELL